MWHFKLWLQHRFHSSAFVCVCVCVCVCVVLGLNFRVLCLEGGALLLEPHLHPLVFCFMRTLYQLYEHKNPEPVSLVNI
jgi:hypothetical protein